MITLKLSVYNQKEVEALAKLLSSARKTTMIRICLSRADNCQGCDYRHLCIDLAQAEMYAKDYTSKH